MGRFGFLAALILAVGPTAQAQPEQRCAPWEPKSDQLVALSIEPQAEGGFVRALRVNGRLVANRNNVNASAIFQLIGPIQDSGFVLYSVGSEAFVEIAEDDLFLFARSDVDGAAVIEFRGNNDGSYALKHIGARRFVELGDEKNGLRFSARRRGDAQRLCLRDVELGD